MTHLVSAFHELSPLGEEATHELTACLYTEAFRPGDLLLKQGQVCTKLFFIEQGIAKTFFANDSREFIMRFFTEGSLFTVVDSFEYGVPSGYRIMALENTSVTYLHKADLEMLCRQHHSLETAYRKLLAIASINMMKRISEMLEENASERYNHFLRDHGHLLQRISLGDLASYLGITQVSLSRIRADR